MCFVIPARPGGAARDSGLGRQRRDLTQSGCMNHAIYKLKINTIVNHTIFPKLKNSQNYHISKYYLIAFNLKYKMSSQSVEISCIIIAIWIIFAIGKGLSIILVIISRVVAVESIFRLHLIDG